MWVSYKEFAIGGFLQQVYTRGHEDRKNICLCIMYSSCRLDCHIWSCSPPDIGRHSKPRPHPPQDRMVNSPLLCRTLRPHGGDDVIITSLPTLTLFSLAGFAGAGVDTVHRGPDGEYDKDGSSREPDGGGSYCGGVGVCVGVFFH